MRLGRHDYRAALLRLACWWQGDYPAHGHPMSAVAAKFETGGMFSEHYQEGPEMWWNCEFKRVGARGNLGRGWFAAA